MVAGCFVFAACSNSDDDDAEPAATTTGEAEETATTAIYVSTFCYWLYDDSENAARSRAFLDRRLRCAESLALLRGAGIDAAKLKEATEQDWYEEYLAAILAVKVVAGVDEAISHINKYSSQHTDAIVSEDYTRAMRFLREVDSASVMVNASTRFADGFEYGLGAEIGISTNKLHARGPVGLEGLTSQKWIVIGSGQVRE